MCDTSNVQPSVHPYLADAVLEAASRAGLGVVVARLEPDLGVIYVSTRAAEIMGRTPEQIVAEPVASLGEWVGGRANVTDWTEPTILRRDDGAVVPVEISAADTTIDGARATVVFIRDVSERVASQNRVVHSEARLRSLLASAPDGIVVIRRWKVAYLNPAASALLEGGFGEVIEGRLLADFIHPDDFPTMVERTASLRPGGPAQGPFECRIRTSAGDPLVIEVTAIRFDDEAGPAVVGFARDVTEARSMQAQLMRADRLAALGTMAAGVAHEINNPLAFMLLGVDSIERTLEGVAELDAIRATLDDLRHGVDRVASIIKQLRTFSRAESTVSVSTHDVAETIRSASRFIAHEIRHYGELELDLDGGLGPVDGAPDQLEQVFINLLLNAAHSLDVKASDGHVVVRARAVGGGVEIVVSDDGCGIAKQDLGRIFDPFFTTKPVGSGTGLGLSICHSIVSGIGGEIRVQSEEGGGTTVVVLLPFAKRPSARSSPRRSTPSPELGGPRLSVLVVDDEPAFLRALASVLAPRHDVTSAENAEQAWAAICAREPDVVLLDLMMPASSGMELYARIGREQPELAERVILMTGGSARPEVERFLADAKRRVLRKPFDEQQVLTMIRKVVLSPRS